MNEKLITKLSVQAANETGLGSFYDTAPYGHKVVDACWDRFAELIVKESLLVVQNSLQGEDEISAEFVYDKIISPVKKHFGIK